MELIGRDVLGFTKWEVGLHSTRSGGAMATFLSGVSTIIIQRIGRWDSDAFMEYIREQVESFTLGVSSKMISNEQFYHLNQGTDKTDIDYHKESSPSHQEYGGPIVIPTTAYFSDNVLHRANYTQDLDKYK